MTVSHYFKRSAWVLPALCWLCLSAAAQPGDAIDKRVEDLRVAFVERTERALRACLAPAYLNRVEPRAILDFAGRVDRSCGAPREVNLRRRPSASCAILEFVTGRGCAFPAAIEIGNDDMIVDLKLWNPWRHFRTRSELEANASDLADAVSLYCGEITDDGIAPWASVHGAEMLSVASMMKLYILIGIAEDVAAGRRSWDDILELRDEDRSWDATTGVMHTWPTGTRLSLQAAAALMIGESDNTATDMLLHLLGARRVEEVLAGRSERLRRANSPFLSSAQLWKLKYHQNGELGKKYIGLSSEERAQFLETTVDRLGVGEMLAPSPQRTTLLRQVGWFASAEDLAFAFRRLWQLSKADAKGTPLAILGIKLPKAFPGWFFEYAGFKAGQDAGLRSTGFIAQANGRWHVVVCVANNKRDIREEDFWAVAGGAVAASGRELAK